MFGYEGLNLQREVSEKEEELSGECDVMKVKGKSVLRREWLSNVKYIWEVKNYKLNK